MREDFIPAGISDEKFDATILRGRAINKITAAERVVVDAAIKVCRDENTKSMSEGRCLELICRLHLESKGVIVEEAIEAQQQSQQAEETPMEIETEEEFLSFE